MSETEYYKEVLAWMAQRGPSRYSTYVNRIPTHTVDCKRNRRRELIKRYAFSIPTRAVIDQLAPLGPFIEVGAGTAYWSYELQQAGADVVATDLHIGESNVFDFEKPWLPLIELPALAAARAYPDRTLLLCWPDDYNSSGGWSDECVEAYERAGGKRIVYVGESGGGCTGSYRLHTLLQHRWRETLELDLPQWEGINDYLSVYELGAGKRQWSWEQIETTDHGYEDDDED